MNKKVPLVVWRDDERVVVGECVIQDVGGSLYTRGKIDDQATIDAIKAPISDIVIGWTPVEP